MMPNELDAQMRMAAFEQVRQLGEIHDHLTAAELKPGFAFQGKRIPLINPQRGIFKPQQMRYLLSIKNVFPKAGGRVWYDDCLAGQANPRNGRADNRYYRTKLARDSAVGCDAGS